MAAQNDNSDLVDKILKVPGIDVNAKDGADKTALDWAADKKNADIIKALLDKGGTIDTTVGAKLLPWAAQNDNSDLVDKILKVPGIDVNTSDTLGNTALHWAAKENHLEVVKKLIEKGAYFDIENNKGNTPLSLATEDQPTHIFLSNISELFDKAAKGNSDEVGEEIYVNARNKDGDTRLHLAAKEGKKEVVENLIKKGAYYNIENKQGKTPSGLSTANEEVYTLLLNIDELFNEAANGNLNQANALIKGAYVNARNKEGDTPLCLAAKNDKKNAVEALLGNPEIDVDVRDENGNTASDLTSNKEIKALLRGKRETKDDKSKDDDQKDGHTNEVVVSSKKEDVVPKKEDKNENQEEPSQQNKVKEGEHSIEPVASTQTEEKTSGFFDSLFDIIIQPISLVVAVIGSFFAWLFWSNTGKTEEHTNQPCHSLVELNSHDYDDQNDLHLF